MDPGAPIAAGAAVELRPAARVPGGERGSIGVTKEVEFRRFPHSSTQWIDVVEDLIAGKWGVPDGRAFLQTCYGRV